MIANSIPASTPLTQTLTLNPKVVGLTKERWYSILASTPLTLNPKVVGLTKESVAFITTLHKPLPTVIPGGAKFYFGQGVGVLVYPDASQGTSLVSTGGLSPLNMPRTAARTFDSCLSAFCPLQCCQWAMLSHLLADTVKCFLGKQRCLCRFKIPAKGLNSFAEICTRSCASPLPLRAPKHLTPSIPSTSPIRFTATDLVSLQASYGGTATTIRFWETPVDVTKADGVTFFSNYAAVIPPPPRPTAPASSPPRPAP